MELTITLNERDSDRLKAAADRYGMKNPANMAHGLVQAALRRDETIWAAQQEEQERRTRDALRHDEAIWTGWTLPCWTSPWRDEAIWAAQQEKRIRDALTHTPGLLERIKLAWASATRAMGPRF